MLDGFGVAVTVFKTGILLVGGLITVYAYRAYRRTGRPLLGVFTVGFGLVALGALLGGVVDRILPLSRDVALVVESGFTLSGFAVVLYSLVSR
jgi:hypothetical protein